MRRILVLGGFFAFCSVLFTLPVSAQDQTISGRCQVTETKYTVSDEEQLSTSDQFVPMPDSRIKFRQGGKKPGCVLVRISGMIAITGALMDEGPVAPAAGDPFPTLRVVLDGVAGIPHAIPIEVYGDKFIEYAQEFVFKNVAPGNHKVAVQWKSYNPGGYNIVSEYRSMVVQYR